MILYSIMDKYATFLQTQQLTKCFTTAETEDRVPPRVMRKPTFWFPTWSDTNRAVQPHKMARGLKFRIEIEEELHYPCGENKGADQLRGYREADLRLCFRICKKPVFSRHGSFITDLSKAVLLMWFSLMIVVIKLSLLIRITQSCDLYPLTPHFYIVKLGFRGIFFS